jgi:hypothetical protein
MADLSKFDKIFFAELKGEYKRLVEFSISNNYTFVREVIKGMIPIYVRAAVDGYCEIFISLNGSKDLLCLISIITHKYKDYADDFPNVLFREFAPTDVYHIYLGHSLGSHITKQMNEIVNGLFVKLDMSSCGNHLDITFYFDESIGNKFCKKRVCEVEKNNYLIPGTHITKDAGLTYRSIDKYVSGKPDSFVWIPKSVSIMTAIYIMYFTEHLHIIYVRSIKILPLVRDNTFRWTTIYPLHDVHVEHLRYLFPSVRCSFCNISSHQAPIAQCAKCNSKNYCSSRCSKKAAHKCANHDEFDVNLSVPCDGK